jgi:hypothetical protein
LTACCLRRSGALLRDARAARAARHHPRPPPANATRAITRCQEEITIAFFFVQAEDLLRAWHC